MIKTIEMDETECLNVKSNNDNSTVGNDNSNIEQIQHEINLHVEDDEGTETPENIEDLKSSLFETDDI
jgi:hypothetical protein